MAALCEISCNIARNKAKLEKIINNLLKMTGKNPDVYWEVVDAKKEVAAAMAVAESALKTAKEMEERAEKAEKALKDVKMAIEEYYKSAIGEIDKALEDVVDDESATDKADVGI